MVLFRGLTMVTSLIANCISSPSYMFLENEIININWNKTDKKTPKMSEVVHNSSNPTQTRAQARPRRNYPPGLKSESAHYSVSSNSDAQSARPSAHRTPHIRALQCAQSCGVDAILMPSVGRPTPREEKGLAEDFQWAAGPGFAPSLSDSKARAPDSAVPPMLRHKQF